MSQTEQPEQPRTKALGTFADTWRRAYWSHREVPGRHRDECCQDECWSDIAQRVLDEITPGILSEIEASQLPAAPAALWRLQGEYVVDRDGLVWRVVRDGGMATRADFTGIESIGIETLRSTKGPLTSLNDFVDAAAGAVPAAPGLDVERLAAALDVLSEDGLEYDLMAPEEREDRDDAAERLAAEYARLNWQEWRAHRALSAAAESEEG